MFKSSSIFSDCDNGEWHHLMIVPGVTCPSLPCLPSPYLPSAPCLLRALSHPMLRTEEPWSGRRGKKERAHNRRYRHCRRQYTGRVTRKRKVIKEVQRKGEVPVSQFSWWWVGWLRQQRPLLLAAASRSDDERE
jgi:hypothetical protein